MSLFKLPYGVYDVLPDECYNLNIIKEKLKNKFVKSGCDFIETPGIEYYDNFTLVKSAISQDKMFKLTDNDGRLLVLRPDITLSAARIAAVKLKQTENKLCYFSNVYEANVAGVNSREIAQGGVEFLGAKSDFSDAEIISLAIESLLALDLKDFIIDIGQIEFFKGLLSGSGLNEEQIEKIRELINKKDLINVEILLKEYGANSKLLDSIMALPSLFGGIEVLDKAVKFTDNEKALSALNNLKNVYKLLVAFGYEKYISIDLGTIKSLSYYTGIVFTGLSGSFGASILTGGRYDNLTAEFGKNIPAVGFAIGLKRVLIALERENKLIKKSTPTTLIAAESGAEKEAYLYAEKLRKNGETVELFTKNYKEAESYAKIKGINVLKVFKKGDRI
jgi:ATP phosphoribosyltransferase regulatory subunit